MIKVSDVSKKIKNNIVLDAINLEVKNQEILGIVGPNGAGKTTLLNIIAGIWPADKGKVEIDGTDLVRGKEAIRQKIGYVPDLPFLYPKLSGREFLSFVGTLYRLDAQKLDQKISELEKALELSFWLDELMDGYPRGVRQKMTLAAMLLHSPKIILLDEPLTNLDPKSSKLVKELLQNMARSGASILLSTHILEIAERLCRRIVIIHEGRKIAEGSIDELRELAKSPGSNLEEVFLQLTGGEKYTELLKHLT
jgi:ABC-2 type transport system ATP-binding protein